MAKEFYDWVKLFLDNWKTLVPVILFILSSTGLTLTWMDSSEKDQELLEKDKQLTNTVNYYTKKEIKIKNPCGKCEKEIAEMNLYIKRQKALEKKLDRALKEYHGE